MTYTLAHFINGLTVNTHSTKQNTLYNPATAEIIGYVPLARPSEVHQAVAAAKAAFPSWSATPVGKRLRILANFKILIEKHMDELANIVTREHGKTIEDAKGSISRGLDVLELLASAPLLLKGSFSDQISAGMDCYSFRQPLGVCAGITPFNFPAMIPLWMFPAAIVCGNTFVLKPSERDPSCALRLVELLHEAGLPKGVVNLIHGDKTAVDSLLTHPDIAAISFVGSTPIAEYVHHTASAQGKRVQAFGGAKNHALVMPDADLVLTADAIAGAAFGSCGQRCMAISVAVVVGDQTADQLLQLLIERTQALRIGPGDQPDIDMGPLISAEQKEKVINYLDIGIQEGAKLIVNGRDYQHPTHPQGYYVGPSIFDKVTADMRIYQEEIFGPVLCVVRVKDEAEGLALINTHRYGNGTAIFTRDGHQAREFARLVQVGMVGINVAIPVPIASYSFGGWKQSIFADLGMYGQESILFNTKLKTVTLRWPQETGEASSYVMPTGR